MPSASPSRRQIAARFIRDAWMPALLAAAYAVWSYRSDSSPTLAEAVESFGVAFFLVMWFVGQFLRVRKQLRDAASLEAIEAGVQSIQARLDRTGAGALSATRTEDLLQAIVDPVTKALSLESLEALKNGLSTSALLAASVAFERAVRNYATRHGIENAEAQPVARLIRTTSKSLGPGVADELYVLWRARNAIVHQDEEMLERQVDPDRLHEAFLWGIATLSKEPLMA